MPPARSSISRSARAVAAIALIAVVGCGPKTPSSPVTGVVVEVRGGTGFTVDSFLLRTREGKDIDFHVGRQDPGGFDPPHMRAHQATTAPVRVTFHPEGAALVATKLEDA